MAAKTSTGWVVQLTHPGVLKVPAEMTIPKFAFFNVAIREADKAVAAVRKKTGIAAEAPIRVVRSLSQPEIAALSLRAGEVKPA
jgi:hypothetical protein